MPASERKSEKLDKGTINKVSISMFQELPSYESVYYNNNAPSSASTTPTSPASDNSVFSASVGLSSASESSISFSETLSPVFPSIDRYRKSVSIALMCSLQLSTAIAPNAIVPDNPPPYSQTPSVTPQHGRQTQSAVPRIPPPPYSSLTLRRTRSLPRTRCRSPHQEQGRRRLASGPCMLQLSAAVPDASVSDDAVPDASLSDDAVPDANLSVDAVPGASVSDDAVPDAILPDDAVGLPDASLSDDAVLDASLSDNAVPDANLSVDAVPDITAHNTPSPVALLSSQISSAEVTPAPTVPSAPPYPPSTGRGLSTVPSAPRARQYSPVMADPQTSASWESNASNDDSVFGICDCTESVPSALCSQTGRIERGLEVFYYSIV